MYKITKRFNWVMGHRLTFHEGGCYNPHGHNYEMKVSVECDKLEDSMVMDFSDLKKVFIEIVHEPLDHSFIVYEEDYFSVLLKSWGANYKPFKIVEVPFETTAENLSKYFFDLFSQKINNENIRVNRVKIYETPSSEAVCYG